MAQGSGWLDRIVISLPNDRVWTTIAVDRAKAKVAEPVAAEPVSPKIAEPELKQAAVVPCGDYTVASGAEAFALIAPYFPDGI